MKKVIREKEQVIQKMWDKECGIKEEKRKSVHGRKSERKKDWMNVKN